VFFGILSLIASSIIALIIWEMVYRPLKVLNGEIGLVSMNKFDSKIKLVNIREFDDILEHFRYMRHRIQELLEEIEKKEKMKRLIEIEKLMHQINPHFLHNTLNSIQWLARMNGQDKIDRLVALLTKILHYNLGKEGGIVTVKQEVDALQSYVDLQRLRFDDQLEIKIDIDPKTIELHIPRFIMQPLVENAIYHGLRGEQGHIFVRIVHEGKEMHVTVKDDGEGLDEDEIERLLTDDSCTEKSTGLGIGLSYVCKMLKVHYGDEAELHVKSIQGKGTVFSLKMPLSIK
jgi:two-component system sensor histidine kinase YesM